MSDKKINFAAQTWTAVAATLVLLVICCGLYPLIVWGIGQGVFNHQANGSLVKRDGSPTTDAKAAAGSAMIGQAFAAPGYFHPRPSAANNTAGTSFSAGGGYDPTSSGGSNFGPLNDTLINGSTGQPAPSTQPTTTKPADIVTYDGIRLRTIHYAVDNGLKFKLMLGGVQVPLKQFQAADGTLDDVALIKAFPHNGADGLTVSDFQKPDGTPLLIPADAVTASASGLDPHISPANAALQAARVANARKIDLKKVQALIDQCTDNPDLGFLGDPGVNVLKLNLALDALGGSNHAGGGTAGDGGPGGVASAGGGAGAGGGSNHGAPGTGPATTTASSDAGRRNLPPSPIDSPPFPSSDWTGPDILVGTGDGTSQSRLEALMKDTDIGKALTADHIRLYGWAEVGANVSSSNHTNGPSGYDLVPDTIDLNQLVLRVERVPDTSQSNHPDWGFRATQLFGTDYRYTTAKGFLSGQLLRNNRLYGYDIPELYGAVYLPHVADGMVVKVGRFLSPVDVESALAPGNYLYSHAIMYAADPATFTGLNTITKLGRHLSAEFGVTAGADMVPFTHSASLNGHAMLSYRNESGSDSLYGGLNSFGNGKYRDNHDDLQQLVGVWGHKFNDRLHMQTEAYYMWEYDAYTGGTVIAGPAQSFAGSGRGTFIPGRSDEWGVVNYLGYKVADNDSITLRTEFFDDVKGERTGYSTMFNSETLGWEHTFAPGILFRPEVRWDHSAQVAAFNNGLRKNQLSVGTDLILSF